ncbi:GNAT family N-acetyltransferase [Fusibacter ferrireducens]|uniref:GNAT family N-acetyltransferase n=1 Tax=Fusibacter ferrireducens TaxID=2785058 RepID=A0ABR9ZPT1_9FIRM|nr:GNAT family N-acetyltransferase [Fusibacter ferrireducens]MBF4691935.1 GNAT family N-acetyltransferase [Fusibacter ferrireducens]
MKIEVVNDARLIAKLNEPVQTLHHELYPEKFKSFDFNAIYNYFHEVMSMDHQHFLVCFDGDEAIGYIWFEEIIKIGNAFSNPSHYLYIQHVSVNENMRGKGVSKLLFDEVLKFANSKSIKRIGLDYWSKNTVAKQIYKKLGFIVEKETTYLTLQ